MATKVGCSLKVYEAKANNRTAKLHPAAAAGGIIEIRIKLRYQLCVKAHGFEFMIEDIVTPEWNSPFAMPLAFLIPEFSVIYVSDMLESLNVDAQVRNFSSPRIAKFAVDVAKRHGAAALSGFKTVAEVSVKKIDYIREDEFNRISRTLKQQQQQQQEDLKGGGSKERLLHLQNVKSEENIS
ncbi:hypothetical protein REPUB_Repub17cG0041100 [Reevesia pubescens]